MVPELVSDLVGPIRRFVGKYELLEEIGRGRQGVVYRAFEEGIARLEVAVKLLGSARLPRGDDSQRFINGVRCLARAQHYNIVDYRGSGDDRGQLYYVMKYVRRSDLSKFLKERGRPLDPFNAARTMIQIAEAVQYLHAQQPPIVHRDLKPHNILLDEAGTPYVANFELARFLGGNLTWKRRVWHDPLYRAGAV